MFHGEHTLPEKKILKSAWIIPDIFALKSPTPNFRGIRPVGDALLRAN
jgi:hypothetical protein